MDVASQLAVIKEMLAEAGASLRSAEPTPKTRELRYRVSTYERIVGAWSYRPPTAPQCAAMMECVLEVHALVLGPRRSRPPPLGPRSAARRSTRPPPSRNTSTRTTKPPPPPPSSRH